MKVTILASGSSGNCIHLQSGDTGILIDAGVPKTKIEKRMIEAGINPASDIQAIFITHAHGDHIKGLPLANKWRIPVWASEGEWKNIQAVDDDLRRVMDVGFDMHLFGTFWVRAFPTHHDSYNSLGYVVGWENDGWCSICLDTGKVDAEMLEAMAGSDVYIIESNHEPNMVEASSYPDSVKARVLSDIGHLSNEQTAAALAKLIKGKGERIYLTHLSNNNNMPALAEGTVRRALRQKGFEAGKHYHLEVV
ncbi:MBL fold metallo-hydrolase [Paenibacillus sp. SM 69]|nr:MBL fold metallo-hydrolase [Paenibacillus oleatilyticus]